MKVDLKQFDMFLKAAEENKPEINVVSSYGVSIKNRYCPHEPSEDDANCGQYCPFFKVVPINVEDKRCLEINCWQSGKPVKIGEIIAEEKEDDNG